MFASRLIHLSIVALVLPILAGSGCTNKRELGNVLRSAVRDKYKSLDPIHGRDHYSNILIRRAYEGLLQYHYLKRPYEVVPLLAESMPAVSKDGLTYTFKIRQGVRFQDDKAFKPDRKGRELTAQDFVYSFKRLMDPAEASDGRWIFDGKVADVQAPERYTLVLKLVRPYPLILHSLTMPYANVVAREVVEHYGKEFGHHPVGTGPFKLQSLSQNQAVWIKNPTFHGEAYPSEGGPGDKEAGRLADAGKPLPFVDKLIDDIIVEDQPAWLNFMQGNHDYMHKIGKDNTADVFDSERKPKKELREKGIQVFVEPGIWFNYIAFNMDDPVVGGEKNRFLRQAMSLALDEAPMIEKFYLGLATKAESLIPPGIGGYDPKYKSPNREYNLVKAREILAKAGHPNGEGIPELVYDVKTDMSQRQAAEYVQRAMAQLGIKIKLNVVSWPEMLNRIRRKQAQVFGITWVYDYPDAENGWQLLYSKNESPGSNEANYKNPKYDQLYEKIAVMRDGPERFALFARMRAIFEEDLPWILTVHQAETRMAQPWVHNFKVHAFDHQIEKYLRVEVGERQKALK